MNALLTACLYILIGAVFAGYHIHKDLEYTQRGGHLLYEIEEYIFICAIWPVIAMFTLFFAWPIRLWNYIERRKGS